MTMNSKIFSALAALAAGLIIFGCDGKDGPDEPGLYDNVLILYQAGFNSLSPYMRDNLTELEEGYLPSTKDRRNVLLVFSKLPGKDGYSPDVSPYLIKYSRKKSGKVVKDTLLTMAPGTSAAAAKTLSEVLNYAREHYVSSTYGLVLSSHANGWLPAGFFKEPNRYKAPSFAPGRFPRIGTDGIFPYVERTADPSLPPVKSVLSERIGKDLEQEMDLNVFAESLPYYLDYILFDVCLMGGVEVAYALKGKCGTVGFSPTEVLAYGYNYKTMTERLLKPLVPDPIGVCKDFFERYDAKSGQERSATVTAVDCGKLEPLANVCKELFEKYRDGIASLKVSWDSKSGEYTNGVQPYFYLRDRHWHYDLKDILAKAGASESDLASLEAALDGCIEYKAATPAFLGTAIDCYSGLSMYLPADGKEYLDGKYKELAWNQATGLVK